MTIKDDKEIELFDVTSLHMSVQINGTLTINKEHLDNDV